MKYLFTCLVFIFSANVFAAEEDPPTEKEQDNISGERAKETIRKFPPIKSGFLVDLDPTARDGFFYFGLEIVDWKIGGQHFAMDFGVASSRVLVGVAWNALFEKTIGPFIWTGYNISENSHAFGIGITMLKL